MENIIGCFSAGKVKNDRNLNPTTSGLTLSGWQLNKLNSGDVKLLFLQWGKVWSATKLCPLEARPPRCPDGLIKSSLLGAGGCGRRRRGSPFTLSPSLSSESLSDSNRSLNSFLSSAFFSWTFLRLISGRSRSSIFTESKQRHRINTKNRRATEQSPYSLPLNRMKLD